MFKYQPGQRLSDRFNSHNIKKADQTVISSLSLVVNPAMESESKLSNGEKEYSDLRQRLIQIKDESVLRVLKTAAI